MISSNHQKVAIDTGLLKNVDGNFEDFIKLLDQAKSKEWSPKEWLEKSDQMAGYIESVNYEILIWKFKVVCFRFGKLLNQSENQKLLGLALSSTFGKPLRYCIQHEVSPAASYWNYFADQLGPFSSTKVEFLKVLRAYTN